MQEGPEVQGGYIRVRAGGCGRVREGEGVYSMVQVGARGRRSIQEGNGWCGRLLEAEGAYMRVQEGAGTCRGVGRVQEGTGGRMRV